MRQVVYQSIKGEMMQLVTLHEDLLDRYLHHEIYVAHEFNPLVDPVSSAVEIQAGVVFRGHVDQLFILERRCVQIEINLNGIVEATFDEAMHNLMAWRYRTGSQTYYLPLTAALDETGNLCFIPNDVGICAAIRRTIVRR